jgi:hypothetical protein
MPQFDVPHMRRKDMQADFKLALLTRYNNDISEEEAIRRLKSLPREATKRALRVQKAADLWPAEWTQMEGGTTYS